jgi:hypothetical protein
MFSAKAPMGARVQFVRGRGDYKSFFRGIGKAIQTVGRRVIPTGTFSRMGNAAGGFAGARLGGSGGAMIGKTLGGKLGNLVSQAVGFGDYHVKKNTLISSGGGDPPVINNGLRSNIIRHREYVCDILSSPTAGAFNIQSFPVNPGMSVTFPWLSSIASSYQEYMFRGLIFEYKTTSADALNSTNTALGTVVLATDYNVLNAAYANKQQMENSDFSSSSKPSCDIIHPVECDPKQTPVDRLFVRTGTVSTGDLRFNDLGNFQIASVGFQGTSVNCGELWCSYEVEFFKPILPLGPGTPIEPSTKGAHWILPITNITNTNIFGTATFVAPTSGSLNASINGVSNTISINPQGLGALYQVTMAWRGVSTASIASPTFTYTNFTAKNYWFNDTVSTPNNPGTSTILFVIVTMQYTGSDPTGTGMLSFGGSPNLPSTLSACDVWVQTLDESIVG